MNVLCKTTLFYTAVHSGVHITGGQWWFNKQCWSNISAASQMYEKKKVKGMGENKKQGDNSFNVRLLHFYLTAASLLLTLQWEAVANTH